MIYKVNEIFLSLKGEGLWSGEPMLFVRFSGCNMKCPKCDTHFNDPINEMTERDIYEALINLSSSAKKVVITGGEPTIQNLSHLLEFLKSVGYSLHLETNGSISCAYISCFDWIALSPKNWDTVYLEWYLQANEIKVPIFASNDLLHVAEKRAQASTYTRNDVIWYLHPWNSLFEKTETWSTDAPIHRTSESFDANLHQHCINYALKHNWRVSVQLHKVLRIR